MASTRSICAPPTCGEAQQVAAHLRFSLTVSGANTSSTWGTYPTPARAISSGGRLVRSRPPTVTVPDDRLHHADQALEQRALA